ncbi:MAG: DUF3619 family protein [Betaproteobacteria bacterium]|nr:DUF3619 family protein [Betaproteobacteria bacterium]
MNELQFGNKIRQALNQGTGLDAPTLERLRAARAHALAAQRVERAPALALADNVLGRLGGVTGLSVRVLIPAALLVGGLLGIHSWQQNQRVAEVVEIDAKLLTDSLPIDAYIDKGFEAWLKKQASS